MIVLSSPFIFTKYNYFTLHYMHEYKIGVDKRNSCAWFKGIQRSGGIYSDIINKALNRGEWAASHPRLPYPRIRSPQYTLNGGWVGYRAGLEALESREISSHCRESDILPRFPVVCLSTVPTALACSFVTKETRNNVNNQNWKDTVWCREWVEALAVFSM
jgi:hypothetical protein